MVKKGRALIVLAGVWAALCGWLVALSWQARDDALLRIGYILISCVAGFAAGALHIQCRHPQSIVIWAASVALAVGYLMKYGIYLVLDSPGIERAWLALENVFPPWAIGANSDDVTTSLSIVAVGFVGLVCAAFLARFCRRREQRSPAMALSRTSWASVAIASIGVTLVVVTGIPRWWLGLYLPDPPLHLPLGLGGAINLTNAYVGPYLIAVALYRSLADGRMSLGRRLAGIMILVGVVNFLIFLSKWSLISPILMILLTQWMLRRYVLSRLQGVVLISGLVVVYPFLNMYRSFSYIGENGFIEAIIAAAEQVMEKGGVDSSFAILVLSLSSMLGRLVGFEGLLTLLSNGGKPFDLFEYITSSIDLDAYLTYQVIGFTTPMGVSPGMLGRFYFISGSYGVVFLATAAFISVLAKGVDSYWKRGGLASALSIIMLGMSIQLIVAGPRLVVLWWFVFVLSAVWMLARVAECMVYLRAGKEESGRHRRAAGCAL